MFDLDLLSPASDTSAEPHTGQAVPARFRAAPLDTFKDELRCAARAALANDSDCAASAELLASHGWFRACLPKAANGSALGSECSDDSVAGFTALAAVDLPVARLFEGHANAVRLVELYADADVRKRVFGAVADGAVLGVWGAEGETPARFDKSGTIRGEKRLCSGLAIVTHAVVSLPSDGGPQLVLVDVSDPARMDPSTWDVVGMRASASGSYDFDGIDDYARIGEPGDYLTEPHFVGGVWRIAALELGGAIGVVEAVRDELQARGRMDYDPHILRLAPLVWEMRSLKAWLEAHVARLREGRIDTETVVADAIGMRLRGEDIALRTVQAAQQCLGLAYADRDNEAGRRMADLSVYVRQVARDAFLQRAGRQVLLGTGAIA